jgi:hypothetical protein
MKILGVDPGIRGGLAIVELNNGAAPRLIDTIDIPVVGVGAKLSTFSLCALGSQPTGRTTP